MDEAMAEVASEIDPAVDTVRVYPQCDGCDDASFSIPEDMEDAVDIAQVFLAWWVLQDNSTSTKVQYDYEKHRLLEALELPGEEHWVVVVPKQLDKEKKYIVRVFQKAPLECVREFGPFEFKEGKPRKA